MRALLELVRDGGAGAIMSLLLAVLAVITGVVALATVATRARSGLGFGLVTLLLSTLSCAAGLIGTAVTKRRIVMVLATLSEVMAERMIHAGFREAQRTSLVAAIAAAAPLVFGLVASIVGAFVLKSPSERRLGEPATVGNARRPAQLAVVVIGALAVMAELGAVMSWKRPLPSLRYDLKDDDHESWALAAAVDEVTAQNGSAEACSMLEVALIPFTGQPPLPWPRPPLRVVPLERIPWKPASAQCVESIVSAWSTSGTAASRWTVESLRGSTLISSEHHLNLVDRFRSTPGD